MADPTRNTIRLGDGDKLEGGVSVPKADGSTPFTMDSGFRDKAHVFVGITPLDSSGDYVLPTTGTITIKIKTDVTPELWETPTGWGAIDITAVGGIATLSVAANVAEIQVTPDTVDAGVDTFQIRATANKA